jgi:pyruvate/2-oxoglutarate dehydrogenase complex dihydrolipoamide acyltransferase (E2) component
MGKYWKPLKNLSSWRKISVGMWNPPSDPTIYGHDTLDVTDTIEYLEEVSRASGTKVSLTALVVKCFATVLAEHPDLNVMLVNGRIQRRESVDIFCQVMLPAASDTSADLSGVKLVDVPNMDVVEVAQRLSGKAKKLRDGQDEEMEKTKDLINVVPPLLIKKMLQVVDFLTFNVPIDLDGIGVRSDPFGSMMVSSIAQFDIKLGYAPLVPASRCPMVALPGVVHDVPMVVDGEVVPRKGLTIGTTFDHRLYDGAQIGLIVRGMTELMQNPRAHFPPAEHWATGETETAANARRPEDSKRSVG